MQKFCLRSQFSMFVQTIFFTFVFALGAVGSASAANFTPADPMNSARAYHRVTTLSDGKVLITGANSGGGVNTAELLDAIKGTYTATGNMQASRGAHTATLLPNGKVLITGGGNYLSSAELYDPSTGTFSATGAMSIGRTWHTATLLPNGKVLVAGGYSYSGGAVVWGTASAELYDPVTGVFTTTGSMIGARCQQISQLLSNGKVLIAGGYSAAGGRLATAELYDPAAGTFSSTGSMVTGRSNINLSGAILDSGKVVIIGGYNASLGVLKTVEIYDPSAGTFSQATGSMNVGRANMPVVRLPSGNLLVVGGDGSSDALSSTEIYNITTQTFSTGPAMSVKRAAAGVVTLSCWSVAVIGGYNYSAGELSSTERFCE